MTSVNEQDPAGEYNFVIRQGDTFTRGIALTNGTTPINLTNSSAVFTMAEQSTTTPVLTLTVGSGITMGGTAGTITMTATATQTTNIDAGVYTYDFILLQNSTVTTLFAGNVTVLGQV